MYVIIAIATINMFSSSSYPNIVHQVLSIDPLRKEELFNGLTVDVW